MQREFGQGSNINNLLLIIYLAETLTEELQSEENVLQVIISNEQNVNEDDAITKN